MKKHLALTSLLALLAVGIRSLDMPSESVAQAPVRAASPPQMKLAAESANGQTCADMQDLPTVEIAPAAVEPKLSRAGKRVTITSLIERALVDQRRLLLARKSDLERWSRADQIHFATWFGTTHPDARKLIYERIRVISLINKEYSAGNFRRVKESRAGLFAYVYANDPSKIYVDRGFVFAPFFGTNCRPGTISHEMSHFTLAGGTQDFVYGHPAALRLARTDARRALFNADNFEFWVEKVR